MNDVRLFILMSRPIFLLSGVLMYFLGICIASYLGTTLDWNVLIAGLIWTVLLQLSTHYFNEYYDSPFDQANPNRTFLTGGSGAIGPGRLSRRTALLAGSTSLAVLASFTVILISTAHLGLIAYLIMVVAFLGAFFYSAPPIRLVSSGYGELVVAIMLAFLLPIFSFILQTGEVHRLLAMTGFPLAALLMAMLLAIELPDYAADLKAGKNTLMVRLGWQMGINLHNIMILTGFLLLLLAGIFGYPRFAVIAGILPLPLGLFQIWQMRGITLGAKPNWMAINISAMTLFALTAYMISYAFWVN